MNCKFCKEPLESYFEQFKCQSCNVVFFYSSIDHRQLYYITDRPDIHYGAVNMDIRKNETWIYLEKERGKVEEVAINQLYLDTHPKDIADFALKMIKLKVFT